MWQWLEDHVGKIALFSLGVAAGAVAIAVNPGAVAVVGISMAAETVSAIASGIAAVTGVVTIAATSFAAIRHFHPSDPPAVEQARRVAAEAERASDHQASQVQGQTQQFSALQTQYNALEQRVSEFERRRVEDEQQKNQAEMVMRREQQQQASMIRQISEFLKSKGMFPRPSDAPQTDDRSQPTKRDRDDDNTEEGDQARAAKMARHQ